MTVKDARKFERVRARSQMEMTGKQGEPYEY